VREKEAERREREFDCMCAHMLAGRANTARRKKRKRKRKHTAAYAASSYPVLATSLVL
jgi:hypothetical protein